MEDAARKPQVECGFDEAPDAGLVDASTGGHDAPDSRIAPRFTLLIRAAKLVTSHGEFIGVLRDVSETGVCVRLFHRAPVGDPVELHMPGGGVYELRQVWERGNEAGYEFTGPVNIVQMVNESGEFPKRGLRLGVTFPVAIRTLSGTLKGVVRNLSQQGARFECKGLFAIDDGFELEILDSGTDLPRLRAKVRWRRDRDYGVVFDEPLALRDFARFAARLQCPNLLD